MSTEFVLCMLIAAMLGIHGALRLRVDPEQEAIFSIGYKYPARLMPLYGAAQLSAAMLVLMLPEWGLPFGIALGMAEAGHHAIRQGIPTVAAYDLTIVGFAVLVGFLKGVESMHLLGGACAGVALFVVMHSTFAKKAQQKRS